MSRVLGAGLRFAGAALRGRARLGMPPAAFAGALVRGVRPHFFVFPAAACLAGAATSPDAGSGLRIGAAAVAVGIAWGVGQLLNDLVDLEADAVDAPDRPAVLGLLPEGPTALVASALGLVVAAVLALCHPLGWLMAVTSALLMLAYAPAKALPGLGNLMHGALMGLLCAIGAAVATPSATLGAVAAHAWPSIACVGAIAALYLQGNYEKDRAGDARAGYRTLAHVLGVRGSAALRAAGGAPLYYAGWHAGLVASPAALGVWSASAGLLAVSIGASLRDGGGRGALAGYRYTVHSTVLALVALALPLLGLPGALALVLIAGGMIEVAFQRTPNP